MAKKRATTRKEGTLGVLIHLRSNVDRKRVMKALEDAGLKAEIGVVPPLAFNVRGCSLGPVVFGGACQPRELRALESIISGLKTLSKGNK